MFHLGRRNCRRATSRQRWHGVLWARTRAVHVIAREARKLSKISFSLGQKELSKGEEIQIQGLYLEDGLEHAQHTLGIRLS